MIAARVTCFVFGCFFCAMFVATLEQATLEIARYCILVGGLVCIGTSFLTEARP